MFFLNLRKIVVVWPHCRSSVINEFDVTYGVYPVNSSYILTIIPGWFMTSSMEAFSALFGPLCGEFPVTGEFTSQRPVTRSFDVFFVLRLNKRLNKQSWGWWFGTPWCSLLWRHCNELQTFITDDRQEGHSVHNSYNTHSHSLTTKGLIKKRHAHFCLINCPLLSNKKNRITKYAKM